MIHLYLLYVYSDSGIFIQKLAFPESPDGRTIAHVTEGNDLHVTQKRSRVLVTRPIDINSASFTIWKGSQE